MLVATYSDSEVYANSGSRLIILLPKSSSKNYALTLKLASLVDSHQASIEGQMFTACFVDLVKLRECEIADKIIRLADNWKGFAVIYKGKTLTGTLRLYQVLPCMMEASECSNPAAHCSYRFHQDSFLLSYQYSNYRVCDFDLIIPCKLVNMAFYDPDMDASLEEQFQARAVSTGIHWCPFFNLKGMKLIPNGASPKKTRVRFFLEDKSNGRKNEI